MIIWAYNKFQSSYINALVTVVTLTIALTDSMWSGILQTLFYYNGR